jgi:hypothetical protein
LDRPASAKIYLARAVAAEAQAGLCLTAPARLAWLDAAKQYRFLADFAERNARS